MKMYRKDPDGYFVQWRDWHVLTMAKARGAALELYARGLHGLDIEIVDKFSEQVIASDKTGTLYPKAPVSSIPFRYFNFTEECDMPLYLDDFRDHIKQFLEINRSTIHARKLLVDFHRDTDPVSDFYLTAAERAFKELVAEDEFDEIALMK
jgi:hypothetical protein